MDALQSDTNGLLAGPAANQFSIAKLEEILSAARDAGYVFIKLEDLPGAPAGQKVFALRLDLDFKPATLRPFVALTKKFDLPITVFVRVFGPYNPLWHPNFNVLMAAAKAGCEIGLHTSAVEWARLHGVTPEAALATELAVLRAWFDVTSVAPHRDINYMYNTLPWLEASWSSLAARHGLNYQAYDKRLFDRAVYVNEGLSPHLTWRSHDPLDVIAKGDSIYMLLHPHWWHVDYPYEHD